MQFFSFLILAVFLVVAQTTFLHFLPYWMGRPDFIFILIAFIAYKFDWLRGGILAFLSGWMLDVVAGAFLGADVIECVMLFILLRLVTQNNPIRQSAYQIPLIGLSYFLVQLLISTFYSFTEAGSTSTWSVGVMVQETIIIIFAAIPSFLLFNVLYEFVGHYQSKSSVARRKTGNRFR